MKNKIYTPLILVISILIINQFTFSQEQIDLTPEQKIDTSEFANEAQNIRMQSFYEVWNTISENYFDRTFSGLDWEKIREEFEPKAKSAKTDEELHSLLSEMVSRLKKSHFGIIPPEVYIEYQKRKAEALENSKKVSDQITEEDDSEETLNSMEDDED